MSTFEPIMKAISILRVLILLVLLAGLSVTSQSQTKKPVPTVPEPRQPKRSDQDQTSSESKITIGSPEAEMLARRDVKAAEKEHEENLERARDAAQLSAEIRDAYLHNKSLGRNEIKRLERLEKITRKIRSEAGGSDGDLTLENISTELEPTLTRLVEVSEKMRKVVEKTPRQVISASVIDRANEVLEIIRYIRTFAQ
jgi:hypothetical protein